MTDELLSCPFCGSTDIEMFYNRSGVDHYTCQYCGASAKDWNSRHESDVVERMRNLLEDVVNALNLSDVAIETHGPLATEPAKLVDLVLRQKDMEIACLRNSCHEPDTLPPIEERQIRLCYECCQCLYDPCICRLDKSGNKNLRQYYSKRDPCKYHLTGDEYIKLIDSGVIR